MKIISRKDYAIDKGNGFIKIINKKTQIKEVYSIEKFQKLFKVDAAQISKEEKKNK